MRAKDLAQVALLLAIGIVLHYIFPGVLFGMKPDLSLSMMFVILMVKRDRKLGFLVALATGIFTALTTTFPGGQLPNIIDKIITYFAVSGLIYLLMDRANDKLANNVLYDKIAAGVIMAVGTIISGVVFLTSALLIVGLPGPFMALFYGVVLPAALSNIVIGIIIYSIIKYSLGIMDKENVAA